MIRTRVNGSLLVKNINKPVSIIGTVISVNQARKSFTFKSTDDQIVTAIVQKPLAEDLTGLVEVHGICQGKAMILCDYYLVFHSQLAETFDAGMDNEAVLLASRIPNAWK